MAPDGWRDVRLDQIARIVGGGTPPRDNGVFWGGAIPWATPSDITKLRGRYITSTGSTISGAGLQASAAALLPSGSLLMTSRATIGACAINEVPMATNQGFQNLVPTDSTIALYLAYLISHRTKDLLRLAAGSTFLEISRRSVAGFSVVLPPLGEQRKIAAILSSVDDAIEGTQAVTDQLQVVRKAVMAELLTRGLPGRHTRFKQTEIGEFADEWHIRPLHEVATIFNGKAAGTGGTWLRVFKTKHVYDGNVRLLKPEYARDDVATRVPVSTFLRPDDVLTPNMAHGTIGRVAFVPSVEDKWTVDGQVMVIRADAVALIGRFVFEWLSLPQGRQRLLDLEKGGAFDTLRGQTHIYPKDVREVAVPVPSIEEQLTIARCAASFDEPLAANADALQALSTIKQGLMQVLLTGEVRVTPDEVAA